MDNVEAGALLVRLYADFRQHYKEHPPYAEAISRAIAALAKEGEG